VLVTASKIKLVRQVASDLMRHEGFREYAYPDPLSEMRKKFKQFESKWGYVSALTLVPKGTDMSTGGPWTVGVGFTNGVTPETRMTRIQAERRLEEEVVELDLVLSSKLSWYKTASDVTKSVLLNMAFNLGVAGLLKFKNTLAYIEQKNFTQAANNMLQSLWAKQVQGRATELAERLRTQDIPKEYEATLQ